MVLDTLEIRNPIAARAAARRRSGRRGGARRTPVAEGVEVDGTVLGAGELAPWLAEHGARGPRDVPRSTPGRWAPAPWPRSRWPRPEGPAAWFDPAQLDEADENAFAAWLADAGAAQGAAQRQGRDAGLRRARLDASRASIMDTALAAYLVKPGRRSFALDALSLEYLGRELAPAAAADGQLAFGADERRRGRRADGAGPHGPRPGRGVRGDRLAGGRRRRAAAGRGAADLRRCWPGWSGTASPRTGRTWRPWSSSSRAPCSRP